MNKEIKSPVLSGICPFLDWSSVEKNHSCCSVQEQHAGPWGCQSHAPTSLKFKNNKLQLLYYKTQM